MSASEEPRSVDLPPTARSASRARHFVLETLRAWGLDGLTDVAALVTTEVVTNAVLHARTTVSLTICRESGSRVSILVRDGSPHPPQRRRPTTDSTSGRGIDLLEQLADSWSVETSPTGKTVQFSLDETVDPWAAAGGSWLDEAEL